MAGAAIHYAGLGSQYSHTIEGFVGALVQRENAPEILPWHACSACFLSLRPAFHQLMAWLSSRWSGQGRGSIDTVCPFRGLAVTPPHFGVSIRCPQPSGVLATGFCRLTCQVPAPIDLFAPCTLCEERTRRIAQLMRFGKQKPCIWRVSPHY